MTWFTFLSWAEFWFNTTYSSSARTTPFKIVYGHDPPSILRFSDDASVVEDVNVQLCLRNQALDSLKEHLLLAQQRMKTLADVKRRELEFQLGELVLLKLKPYHCRSLAKRFNEKLSPRFYGPFEVLQHVGSVAYRLKLPETACIHNVFHVSQLKGFKGREYFGQPLPPQLTEELELVVEPEAILQVRTAPAMQGGSKEVLVKWLSLPDWEATWEPLAAISSQFSDFNLEDKVLREEESNDRTFEVERPPIKFVYTRRGKKVNIELAESKEKGVMGAELARGEGDEC
ncbi:hypothetical protein UlMin_035822 [Ulmus minor]